ncbi:hypothetical protein [Haploplasma axanthum]|nr:hypothetical protein [Haploplasma axanthum]
MIVKMIKYLFFILMICFFCSLPFIVMSKNVSDFKFTKTLQTINNHEIQYERVIFWGNVYEGKNEVGNVNRKLIEVTIPIEAELKISPGLKINKGDLLYTNDDKEFFLNDAAGIIIQILRREDNFYILILSTDNITIDFYSKNRYEVNQLLWINTSNEVIGTKIAECKVIDSGYIYTTSIVNFENAFSDQVEILIQLNIQENVFYIDSKFVQKKNNSIASIVVFDNRLKSGRIVTFPYIEVGNSIVILTSELSGHDKVYIGNEND